MKLRKDDKRPDAKPAADDPIVVEILEAKENPMFTEEQRSWIRFLRYSRAVPCAECGKKKRVMWTMLCEFFATTPAQFILVDGERRMPLTPVCGDHPLRPAYPKEPATTTGETADA